MSEQTIELQQIIDDLNSKNAAFGVQIEELQKAALDHQHEIDLLNEANDKRMEDLAAKLQKQLDDALAIADSKVISAVNTTKRTVALFSAQNHYVNTLESQVLSGIVDVPSLTEAFTSMVKANKAATIDQLQREIGAQ